MYPEQQMRFQMIDYEFVAGPVETCRPLALTMEEEKKVREREREVVNALWTEKKKVGGNERRSVKGG